MNKMHLVTAIIQPFMVDKLTRALRKARVGGYTIAEARGSSFKPDDPAHLNPRLRVEVVVHDDMVDEVIDIITTTVNTHQKGDGVVFAFPLSRFIDID